VYVLPRSIRRSIPLAVMLLLVAATANAQQRVGVNAAVNADATGTIPNGASRRLVIGENVVFNERIQTTTAGQTQVLFLDQSTMTVGPNSDITIDQFVYNPAAGTGTMALSASKGPVPPGRRRADEAGGAALGQDDDCDDRAARRRHGRRRP